MEYFMGSERGRKVKKIIEDTTVECLVSVINLAEVYAKSIRTDGMDKAEERRSFIQSRCAVIDVDDKLAIEAAKIDVEMKKRVEGWGLADSIVLATARATGAKIITWDKHFFNLAETETL
jgi:predicted nucleic acid-binding protein